MMIESDFYACAQSSSNSKRWGATQATPLAHPSLRLLLTQDRRRPRALCRSAQVHPVEIDDSNAETHFHTPTDLLPSPLGLCRYCVQEVGTASDAVQPLLESTHLHSLS